MSNAILLLIPFAVLCVCAYLTVIDHKTGIVPNKYIFVLLCIDVVMQFAMDKNLTLPLNEWIHAAMTVDRAGKITLYINGEEAGSRSIAAYEKENVFEKEKNSNFASYLGGEIRIARVKVKNDLSSRIQIQKETDQWLDSVEE